VRAHTRHTAHCDGSEESTRRGVWGTVSRGALLPALVPRSLERAPTHTHTLHVRACALAPTTTPARARHTNTGKLQFKVEHTDPDNFSVGVTECEKVARALGFQVVPERLPVHMFVCVRAHTYEGGSCDAVASRVCRRWRLAVACLMYLRVFQAEMYAHTRLHAYGCMCMCTH